MTTEMKRPWFVECSVPSVRYLRGETVNNNPVNISLCTSIRKGQYRWYPDNEGLPSIVFDGCEVKWVYNSAKERDLDFENIVKNHSALEMV